MVAPFSEMTAYYGLSTQQAAKLGMTTGEGVALYAECLRGRVFSPNGLLKLVYDKATERIIGVHICGEDACELVHYGMELVRSRRTITEVAKIMFSAVVSRFFWNCSGPYMAT
jgi:NAD(P) transhydrogenase